MSFCKNYYQCYNELDVNWNVLILFLFVFFFFVLQMFVNYVEGFFLPFCGLPYHFILYRWHKSVMKG